MGQHRKMRALIVLAILGSALAVPTNPGRIVGGEDTNIETYPFIVALQYYVWNIFWMQGGAGSLITPTTVLTCAHCVEINQPEELRFVMGTSLRSGVDGQIYQCQRFLMHPEYNKTYLWDADVALVFLTTTVAMTPRIQTSPIASARTQLVAGLPIIGVGWGRLSYEGPLPDKLQHVEMYVVDHQICAERYANLGPGPDGFVWANITDNMSCNGIRDVGGKATCGGDSGGPIVWRGINYYIIVGITSWAYQCADSYYPGVMAHVPAFTAWIVDNAT